MGKLQERWRVLDGVYIAMFGDENTIRRQKSAFSQGLVLCEVHVLNFDLKQTDVLVL
jgi:hypothetical protein